jgi:hypothetical protein
MEEEKTQFTDYLIKKGIISNDIILELLIDQYRRMPSTIEVVVGKKILPIYKIYKIFESMDHYGFDFQRTAENLDMWTEDCQKSLERERKKYKLPIGQIIVRKKLATTSEMVKLLEEYHTEIYGEPHKPNEMMEDIETTESGSSDFTVEFLAIDEESLTDYLSTVDTEKRSEIEHNILEWEKLHKETEREAEFEKNINFVYREYHTIKGSSKFIRAELIGKIVHEAEGLLSVFKDNFKKISQDTVERMSSVNLSLLDIVWGILDCLYQNHSEEPYWEIETNKEKVLNVITEIEGLKKEIS